MKRTKLRLSSIVFFVTLVCSNEVICVSNQAILTISIPKCGTHLLFKVISILTGVKKYIPTKPEWGLLDEKQLNQLNFGDILVSHALCTEENVEVLRNISNVKKFFAYRDPRDQIISSVYFVKHSKLASDIAQMSINERIFHFIYEMGMGAFRYSTFCKEIYLNNRNINQFYNLYLPWIQHEDIYVTTFEKLVGPKGGGDLEVQLNEIQNIAKHIGMDITRQRAKQISDKLFGGTGTFRAGQIGDWKKHFTKEHKKAFKEVAGQLLIDLDYEQDFDW